MDDTRKKLPPKLTETVSRILEILGNVIKEQEGENFYKDVEKFRLAVKKIRTLSHEKSIHHLIKLEKEINKKNSLYLNKLNKSFSIYLELCNACETAYRTVKLREKASQSSFRLSPEKEKNISFVFTAHPTEARSPHMIRIMFKLNKLIQEYIQFKQKSSENKIHALISRAMRAELAPHVKPSVQDEAFQVSSIALRDEVLNTIRLVSENNIHMDLRSWAGGDKDGNPFVTEIEFKASLQISREILVKHVSNLLESSKKYVLDPRVGKGIAKIENLLRSIEKITINDGKKILKLHQEINYLKNLNDKKLSPPEIQDFYNILKTFPALVMPLEFREEAALIKDASKERPSKKSAFAITRMLLMLKEISGAAPALFYVKGLILSQLETPDEVKGAIDLQRHIWKSIKLPVIPLLETKNSLINYKKLLSPLLNYSTYKKVLKKDFSNKLEVMLGYSDTSKVLGSLPSRVLLFEIVGELNNFVKRHQCQLLLFHGSGGSVDRGGGPISEQVSWIPSDLMQNYKATIQGEMIARTLASSEILLRNIEVITNAQKSAMKKESYWKDIEKFSTLVESHYSNLIKDQKFLDLVILATPYSYLNTLKIGSRPSKRASDTFTVESLRAIPWVLCWTQTRALIQTWWGIGSAWSELSKAENKSIRKHYEKHPVLNSFVKLLGFTLEKIKPSILKLYLRELGKESAYAKDFEIEFLNELKKTQKFFKEITNNKSYTWYRPWLSDSISIRSPIIHILNIIQLQAIKRHEDHLLRETVTGISSGMLTTG